MKTVLLKALKVAVSAGLIAYLLYAIDLRSAIAQLRDAAPVTLALAFVILVLQLLISAWKWQIALAIHSARWRLGELFRIVVIALFFNNFLPTAVGGDLYRAYRTLPPSGRKSGAVSALLLERGFGLLALLFVGAAGAAVLYAQGQPEMGVVAVALACPLLAAALAAGLVQTSWFRPLAARLARIRKLEPLVHNAKQILGRPLALLYLAAVSVLFQALAIVAIVMLFAAIGTVGVVFEAALAGAMYGLASLIPISINGLGVMEGSFALTAERLGIDLENAVVVTLFLRLLTIVLSLVGGLVFIQDKGRNAPLGAGVGDAARASADDSRTSPGPAHATRQDAAP